MTAEKEICLNWSRKNKELREENWSGERDRKKTENGVSWKPGEVLRKSNQSSVCNAVRLTE